MFRHVAMACASCVLKLCAQGSPFSFSSHGDSIFGCRQGCSSWLEINLSNGHCCQAKRILFWSLDLKFQRVDWAWRHKIKEKDITKKMLFQNLFGKDRLRLWRDGPPSCQDLWCVSEIPNVSAMTLSHSFVFLLLRLGTSEFCFSMLR